MAPPTMPRRLSFPALFGAAAICVSVLAASTVRGQDPEHAEALFNEGKRLLDEGNAWAACPKIEAALGMTADASAAGRMLLARCYEAIGRLGSAWRLYRDIAKADNSREAREAGEALAPRIHQLTITASPTTLALRGLHIEIDTHVVSKSDLELPIAVDAGPIPLLVTADNKEDWALLIDVPSAPGTTAITIPELRDSAITTPNGGSVNAPSSPPFWTGERIAGLTLGLTGVAVLAISGGMAALAKSNYDEALVTGKCTGTAPPACEDVSGIDDARALGNATTGVFFGGLALVGVGVIVFASTPTTPAPAPILRASLAPIRGKPAMVELIGAW